MVRQEASRISHPHLVELASTDAITNLRLEEELLELGDLPFILVFYVNSPSVILGRNNREEEWVYLDEVRRAGIPLLRRKSGGGAVYHDLGNLNYAFIMDKPLFYRLNRGKLHLMDFFRGIVIEAFAKAKIQLEKSGKSDIFLNGKKVGGSAALIKRDRILFHGTLLFQVDYSALERFLPIPPNRESSLSHRLFVTSFEREGVKIGFSDAKSLIIEQVCNMLEDSSY